MSIEMAINIWSKGSWPGSELEFKVRQCCCASGKARGVGSRTKAGQGVGLWWADVAAG